MLTFAWYLFKVIICSGILYGYYLLALRNKIFHWWNRFYLLAAIAISLVIPLIKINVWQNADQHQTQVVQLLQVVSSSDEIVFNYTKDKGNFQINTSNLSEIFYFLISGLLLVILIQTLLKIKWLKRNNKTAIIEGINFIDTTAKGTPFSFFNNIFWNNKIDINTSTGKQIFKHEVAHVQEKHSYDKVFMNVVLIFFWCNPFFWLMRKELNIIHEFIADQKALEDSDTAAFAAMILQATYPQHHFNIANNFFYSPVKRRLLMLTKNKNPKINYFSRLLVLPLAALIFFAFTLKMKTISSANHYSGKKITVIIDAGHGGIDRGISVGNYNEKDIALAIAKKIKELNGNEHIDIILSREKDEYLKPIERINIAKLNDADLFISIHADGELVRNTHSGMNLFISGEDNGYLNESKILGSDIIQSFKNYSLPLTRDLRQRDKGLWILNKCSYPAVLIETGFLTTQRDLQYLIKQDNQQTIARNILDGIEKYAMEVGPNKNLNNILKIDNDSIPQFYKGKKIKTAFGSNSLSKAVIIYLDGSSDTISIKQAEKIRIIPPPPSASDHKDEILSNKTSLQPASNFNKNHDVANENPEVYPKKLAPTFPIDKRNSDTSKHPLWIVDGKEISGDEIKRINPSEIQSISVLKNESAEKKYGSKAKDGVIEITLKKDHTIKSHPITLDTVSKPDKIFTKTETPAQFPGGSTEWTKYITKEIKNNIDDLMQAHSQGTCIIKFIVDVDGSVSDVHATKLENTKLAEVSIEAIRKGPKWIPARQNGRAVASYREQPVTFTFSDKLDIKHEPF